MSAIAIITCIVGVLGLLIALTTITVKVVTLVTEVRVYVAEMRAERPAVKTIPMLHYRLGIVEKHLSLSQPDMPTFNNGSGNHE